MESTTSSAFFEALTKTDSWYGDSAYWSSTPEDEFSTLGGISKLSKNYIPSEEEKPQNYKPQLVLYDVLIPAIGVTSIILNIAVVASSGLILKRGQQPKSTYLFLGNVAMTDLVTAIFIIFGQMFPSKYRDHYVCAIQLGFIVSSTLASVYSVGLIAVDRFLFILHGLQYQRWVYPIRVRVFILMTWVLGFVIGFLPLLGWYGNTDNGRVCWFILLAPSPLILLTVFLGTIPILVVVILYSMILYRAIKKIGQIQQSDAGKQPDDSGLRMYRGGGNAVANAEAGAGPTDTDTKKKGVFRQMFFSKPQEKLNTPSKWKAIKVVVFTTSSFIITWVPYFIVSTIYTLTCEEELTEQCKTMRILVASPLAILGFVNTLVNPIIYAWWHKGFRTFIKKRYNTLMQKRKTTQATIPSSGGTASTTVGSKRSSYSSSQVTQEPESSVALSTKM